MVSQVCYCHNEGFAVFVGGCGVGERATLAEAEAYLHTRAVDYCDRKIADANAVIAHYMKARWQLVAGGLTRKKPGEPC